jgi:phospholipid/cholesterol/gamma-HCH transport system permease protein
MASDALPPQLTIQKPPEGILILSLAGEWRLQHTLLPTEDIASQIEATGTPDKVLFNTEGLTGWDSGLLIFLSKVMEWCASKGIPVDRGGLPEGVQKLLDLSAPERQRKGVTRGEAKGPFLVRVADAYLGFARSAKEMVAFVGEATYACWRLLRGKASFRSSDLFVTIQECGAQALPIVSLICFIVGLILAFVGAVQLRLFGAQIYVADVVGVGMTRVMGAIMTGIIMAGRTGASFAAQLGTMQVTEEIDALETLGVSPMEYLVLPRLIALVLMMPLLCVYADLMGLLGGLFVGVVMLDLNPAQYYHQTLSAVTVTHFLIGIFHSAVFGVLIALSGCLRGMQTGRTASDVGYAATSAVVTSITGIVIATGVITVSCEVLGI